MNKTTLEVCVDSVASALAAVRGGADRLELCAALSEGGLTPTLGLYRVIKRLVLVPVFVMIRVRAGFDFVFSQAEKEIMALDCHQFVESGADGFVIGALTGEQEIDIEFIRQLKTIIGDRPITFHRAFDVVREPTRALEELISLGVTRVLTSGQRKSVADGLPLLQRLQAVSAGRIILLPGSGVHSGNILSILSSANPAFQEIHLSGKRTVQLQFKHEKEVCANDRYPEFGNTRDKIKNGK
ncbi:hypothetical protein M8J75_009851 [Diaphorina citri]|nr:hypothetical protein M8J75_009851 [Diaphorina citri]